MLNKTKTNRLLILTGLGLLVFGVSFLLLQNSRFTLLFRRDQVYTHLQGSLDQNSYKTIVLPNKLQVVLITNPETLKGAACLKVQVGNMHSPSNHPGLAHLLEHMLLTSTKAHPDTSHYRKFIQDHSGFCNAITYQEYTEYHFDVSSDYLGQALDIFSGFFKYPLIDAQYLEKELNIVHNEMETGMGNDAKRAFILGLHLTKPESPLSKFTTGSRETLKNTKREHLLCFWKQYYRPDKMQLVVYGKESHDVLEGYVKKHFSGIKTHSDHQWIFPEPPYELLGNTLPKPSETDTSHELIRSDLQNKLVYYKPQSSQNTTTQLTVKINLPQSLHAYKEKTAEFIVDAFNEGKELNGFNLLINNGVIVSSSCNYAMSTTATSITIEVELKSSTQPQIESIINLIQAKLELVRKMGTQELYATYKKIFQNRMEDYNIDNSMSLAIDIAENLPWIALEDIFSIGYKWEIFNAKEFHRFVDIALDRSKWLVTVRTNALPADAPLQTEPYYGIKYAVVDLTGQTDDKIDSITQQMEWSTKYIFDEVDLTKARQNNQLSAKFGSFITNTNLCPFIDNHKYISTISHAENGLDARLVHDKGIITKKTRVAVILEAPDFEKDVSTYVAFRGYVAAYLKGFRLKYYEHIRVSNTNIAHLDANAGKLRITFHGYPLVIQDLIDLFFADFAASHQDYLVMAQTLTPIVFDNVLAQQPESLCNTVGFRMYTQALPFTPTELAEAARHIKLEDIIVITQAKISIFVFGNTTEQEFRNIITTVKKHVTPTTLPQAPKPTSCPMRLELPTVDKLNNAVMLIHEVAGPSTIRNYAMAGLVYQLENETFFNQLRVKEGLGYIASCDFWGFGGKAYVSLIIQGSKDVDLIETRMRAFVQAISDHIAHLSDEEFKKHKESLITNLRCTPFDIVGYANDLCFYWENIDMDFEAKPMSYINVASITKTELVEYMRQHANDFTTICSSNKFTKFTRTTQATQ
ncbi:insulysin [Nematocida homosporus]|uniref:insulysin n=1 Tax=Nematocida homosporus TaxID=1912981 RepID=UPI00221EE1CF|nr:insulysin [Nematocida homosporus]KAI5185698.1 insulysin [Nematocida homosporus]